MTSGVRKSAKKRPASGVLLLLGAAVLLAGPAWAQQGKPDLSEMSIEQLLQVRVTSAAKREQPLADTAAAIYVITSEDIRRSGMTTIPEALRLAPGVEVAQINGNTWAITIRGMNYRFADKLLVMIDGRTIYSSIFSGVFWELQDMPLEDVERIEVIRGPGGTLWGANAMNGVINIITKRARDTQGLLISSSGGSQGYRQANVRYGDSFGESLFYRVYGKYRRWDRTPGLVAPGPDAYDAWDDGRGGFRMEWAISPTDAMTVMGDAFRGAAEMGYPVPLLVPPYVVENDSTLLQNGGNLLARWQRILGEKSDLQVQAYYDRMRQSQTGFSLLQEVFDIEMQYRRRLGDRQELILGTGVRSNRNHTLGNYYLGFDPARRTLFRASGFVQDEFTLLRDRLWLTLGSKFESNEYTGFEVQPSVRLRWQLHAHHLFWAAVSRAVTTPNDLQEGGHRADQVFPGPGGLPVLTMLTGSRNLEEQELLAYELGYRTQPHRKLSLDVAAFYNIYNHFSGVTPGKPFLDRLPPPPHLVMPLYFSNPVDRHTYGFEAAGMFTPKPYWKLSGSYSWLMQRGIRSCFSARPFPSVQEMTRASRSSCARSCPCRTTWNSTLACSTSPLCPRRELPAICAGTQGWAGGPMRTWSSVWWGRTFWTRIIPSLCETTGRFRRRFRARPT